MTTVVKFAMKVSKCRGGGLGCISSLFNFYFWWINKRKPFFKCIIGENIPTIYRNEIKGSSLALSQDFEGTPIHKDKETDRLGAGQNYNAHWNAYT